MQESGAVGEPCGHFENESRVRFSTKVMNKSRTILFLSFEPHSTQPPDFVMPGLVPGIHVLPSLKHEKTWMAGTNPGHDENLRLVRLTA
jgi:hypothetical protein